MNAFLTFTVIGLVIGASYAIAASGLVLTYATTRVFNVAHGATAMVMAFAYWELAYHQGLGQWPAMALVVCVIAPLYGVLLERAVMRRVADASVGVTLVVTVAILVGLFGAAQKIWPSANRIVHPFFAGHFVTIGRLRVADGRLLTMGLALAVGAALYGFLTFTRTGVAMRATVDDKELLALHGGRPHRMSSLAWAAGSAMAALAGILLVSETPPDLNYFALTLIVINCYAAAMAGRLTSLPWTFVGALAMGLLESYAAELLPTTRGWVGVHEAVPAMFLLLMLLAMPQAQLRIGRLAGIPGVRTPALSRVALASAGLVAVTAILAGTLDDVGVHRLALALVLGILALSMVPLTGYSGYVSLAQFSFFGVGALVVAKTHSSAPTAVLGGALIAAGVGVLVALPSLRLQGLYLALSTIAFAQLMDILVFQSPTFFAYGGSLPTKRLDLLGYRFQSDASYAILAAGVFCVLGAAVILLRRGRYGRILIALRDSPAACATLGLNPRFARVAVFAGSACIAGLGGGLYAGLERQTGSADFQFFNSLPLLLVVVCAGVTSVSGAALAGLMFMGLESLPNVQPVLFLVLAVAAIGLGKQPNGIAGWAFGVFRGGTLSGGGAGRYQLSARSLARTIAARSAPGPVSVDETGAEA